MQNLVELNAFNFEFPDVQDQWFLELEIDRFQVDKAMEQFLYTQTFSKFG